MSHFKSSCQDIHRDTSMALFLPFLAGKNNLKKKISGQLSGQGKFPGSGQLRRKTATCIICGELKSMKGNS